MSVERIDRFLKLKQNTKLSQKFQKLERDLIAIRTENKELRSELTEIDNQFTNLRVELVDLNEKLAKEQRLSIISSIEKMELERHYDQLTTQHSNGIRRIRTQCEEEKEALKNSLEQQIKENSELELVQRKLNEEVKKENAEFRTKHTELNGKVQELERKLIAIRTEKKELR